MKFITLHSDFIKFKALKKAIKSLDLSKEPTEEHVIGESLVILTAIEKGDDKNTINKLVKEVKNIVKQVKASTIVLYPYAHLSSNLSSPARAQRLLHDAKKELKKSFKKVVKAPFGYYKTFEIKVKGHPLSELSREITNESEVEEVEEEYDTKQLLKEISKSKLDTSKLKDNDHRILGRKMDLFSFHDSAPGSVFWHSNGLVIFNELVEFWREVHKRLGYKEISTPQILDNRIWKISGHWKLYKGNMFLTNYEKRDFAVKPMNCPGAMLVYKMEKKSYKDLPLRLAEIGTVHRQELSGVIGGLLRVIKMTQDDAHIFCTKEQLEPEIVNILKLFKEILDKFGFKYRFTISVRSKEKESKYLGDNKLWKRAEGSLKNGLKKLKLKYNIEHGEAKFYGPSLDVQIKDSLGREWQCSTIQLDFNLPSRFNLKYVDKNSKEQTPIVLHRVVYGSIERFIGILLEHTSGNLPTWLSPIQVRIINYADRNNKYIEEIINRIKKKVPNIRIDKDINSVPLPGKIRDAELMKIPYIIVLGDKEEKSKKLAIRKRGTKKIMVESLEKFVRSVNTEIKERK